MFLLAQKFLYKNTYMLNRFEAHCRKSMILCPCCFWGLFWCIFCLLCVNFKHFQFRYRDFVSNLLSSFRMVDSAIKHHVSLVRHFAFAAIHSSVSNLGLCDDATGSGKPFVGVACFGFCESFQETQRQPAPREAANKGTGQWNRIVSIWPSNFLSYPNQSAYHCNIIHNSYENHCHESNKQTTLELFHFDQIPSMFNAVHRYVCETHAAWKMLLKLAIGFIFFYFFFSWLRNLQQKRAQVMKARFLGFFLFFLTLEPTSDWLPHSKRPNALKKIKVLFELRLEHGSRKEEGTKGVKLRLKQISRKEEGTKGAKGVQETEQNPQKN